MDLIIILVHGTKPMLFGHSLMAPPTWTHAGSTFRSLLAAQLPQLPTFVEFEWSGANTHAARLAAADRLAERILELRRQFPTARLAVVAHSHGGNVAMYALRRLAGNAASSRPVDALVCLGTPFMRATLRDLGSIFQRLVISLFYGGFFACIALLMTGPFIAQLSVTGARGVLVVSVLGFIIWRLAGSRILGRVFTQRRIAALHTKAQDVAAAVDSRPLFRVPPTLVVKSGRDEAKIWLTLVDRLASLLSGETLLRATSRLLLVGAQVVDWLQRHRRTVLVPAAIALGLLLNLLGSTRWKGIQLKGLVLMPAVLLMLVSVMHSLLFVAIVFVVRGTTLAFGQSLFLSVVAMVRASDHLTDDVTPGLDVATVALPATAFHHVSFYVDPAAIGSIGEWIADTLSKAPALTEG